MKMSEAKDALQGHGLRLGDYVELISTPATKPPIDQPKLARIEGGHIPVGAVLQAVVEHICRERGIKVSETPGTGAWIRAVRHAIQQDGKPLSQRAFVRLVNEVLASRIALARGYVVALREGEVIVSSDPEPLSTRPVYYDPRWIDLDGLTVHRWVNEMGPSVVDASQVVDTSSASVETIADDKTAETGGGAGDGVVENLENAPDVELRFYLRSSDAINLRGPEIPGIWEGEALVRGERHVLGKGSLTDLIRAIAISTADSNVDESVLEAMRPVTNLAWTGADVRVRDQIAMCSVDGCEVFARTPGVPDGLYRVEEGTVELVSREKPNLPALPTLLASEVAEVSVPMSRLAHAVAIAESGRRRKDIDPVFGCLVLRVREGCAELLASDRWRLAQHTVTLLPSAREGDYAIPVQAFRVLLRAGNSEPIRVFVEGTTAILVQAGVCVRTTLETGTRFPDTTRVVPRSFDYSLEVDRDEFVATLQQLSETFREDDRRCVEFVRDQNSSFAVRPWNEDRPGARVIVRGAVISSGGQVSGDDVTLITPMYISDQGENNNQRIVAFNVDYLLEFARSAEGSRIVIGGKASHLPHVVFAT